MKVKLEHPGARHVVAVWRIPGMKTHENDDFQDDQEHGAGCVCLNLMKDCKISHRVFYIARYYGGEKMSSNRYVCYLKAMQSCLKRNEDNPLTKDKQNIRLEDDKETVDQKVQKYHRATNTRYPRGQGQRGGRGRGGGGGRGGRGRGYTPGSRATPMTNKVYQTRGEEHFEQARRSNKRNDERGTYAGVVANNDSEEWA